MRNTFPEFPHAAIRREHRVRMLEELPQVLFIDPVKHAAGSAVGLNLEDELNLIIK